MANPLPLRVLLVEDSQDDAFLLLRELRKGGFNPEYLRLDSLDSVAESITGGTWDIVISDYNLPRFNALDVIALIRERRCDVPVIVVSGIIGEDLAVETMHAGAHDYIMKDNPARLVPAVRRELAEALERRERRRAQRALRQSEARFRQLTESIEEVFWLFDCEHEKMLYVSPAFEKVWHRSPNALFRRAVALLHTLHPDDHERVKSVIAQGWAAFNMEYRINRPDGSERWVQTRSFPVKDKEGKVARVAGLTLDISERKRLESETQKLTRALEQAADAVMIMNRDGVIEYVNGAFEDMSGYGRDEVVNQVPKMLRSGSQDEAFFKRVWRTLKSGIPLTDVFVSRRKNGDLYCEEKTITPVRDQNGDITHFVSTGRDITSRLRIEERLQRSERTDHLTGLANQVVFSDHLQRALLHARRLEGMVAVLFVGIDLAGLLADDGEKGLEARLLPLVADRLRESAGDDGFLARLGRAEFAILLREVTGRGALEEQARRVMNSFEAPILADGYQLFVTPCIGISVFPDDGEDSEQLLRNADIAMRDARRSERSGYRFFDVEMRANSSPRVI